MLAVPPGSFLREGILKVGLEAALEKSRLVSIVPPPTAPAPGSPGPGGAGGAAAPGAARWGETLLEGGGGGGNAALRGLFVFRAGFERWVCLIFFPTGAFGPKRCTGGWWWWWWGVCCRGCCRALLLLFAVLFCTFLAKAGGSLASPGPGHRLRPSAPGPHLPPRSPAVMLRWSAVPNPGVGVGGGDTDRGGEMCPRTHSTAGKAP